ncbi:MAG: LD-carboxypeptidase [Lachnospiraceae bacterium]|nr:LD-carboxypeptidase [Lachnospiraceae bacterium]
MRYPEFIKKGDPIGIVSPSFSVATEPYRTAFRYACDCFKERGHLAVPGPNIYKSDGIGISTDPASCARELTEAYEDPALKAIISSGGGELMCETISEVDFERIGKCAPKWYMGYSDNTNFTFLLTTLCDTASIYGPCASSFGMDPVHRSLSDALDLLEGKKLVAENYDLWEKEAVKDEEHPLAPYNLTEPVVMRGFLPDNGKEGYAYGLKPAEKLSMKGRLLGGCLDSLANLAGTRFDRVPEFVHRYRNDGIIWYLEACDLNVFSIRRAMWELEEAGWFEGATGFLFGRAVHGEEIGGLDLMGAELCIPGIKHSVPVIAECDIGHMKPMMTLINGALSGVSYSDNHLVIDMGIEL